MKTWLFALLQSAIALLGCAAYFLADNIYLAATAAVLAAALGIAQPIISAYKTGRLQAYQDRQFLKSVGAVDSQVKQLLAESIDPPLPHRPTVVAVLRQLFERQASQLIEQYDEAVTAIESGDSGAAESIEEFRAQVDPWSVGNYLHGLAAYRAGDLETAHQHFTAATEEQSAWAAPWLGWAWTSFRLRRWNEICERHPHLKQIELLPYDAGDQDSFLALNEAEREELSQLFQQTASSLGNFYAMAEFSKSGEQIAESREELKRAA